MPAITKNELQEVRDEYQTHFQSIDNEVVEQGDNCAQCGAKLKYEGWKGFGEYRAFAVCTNHNCDYAEDF